MSQENNQNNSRPTGPKRSRRSDFMLYILIIVIIIAFWFFINKLTSPAILDLSYSEITEYISEGKVEDNSTITATPVGGSNYDMFEIEGTVIVAGEVKKFSVIITTDQLNELMDAYDEIETPNFTIMLKTLSSNIWLTILINFLPFLLLIGIFIYMSRQGGNSKAFDFAKNTAKLSRDKTVTFKDVAACDEEKEELLEIIDFLKNPKKYVEIGARIPKGVLLFGPPGTGKTLLAKAVAGESNVPFFSISGSDFVEMFVGLGASRVRDLFKTAKENAPCILFIDEIDAVGRQRGTGMGGGHDEREQTLNQLLVEMDGFNTNLGIIVMAATNRPDVLDPALLRPGRFDRQITINAPDVNGRTEILKVHARNKHLEEDIKLNELAQRIPGFTGADIENLLNEAALLAARGNRKIINLADLDEATDRVLMGPAKKSRKITDNEKNRIAHHEAGHAVIGLKLDNANIVQKVTIIPRGRAGGYALMLPEEETYLETTQSLLDRITGFLAGRVSEEINFKEVSNGAYDDFKQATKIARAMVTEYGMSSLGTVQYEEQQGNVFLGRDYLKEKNFSDQIALEIDIETRKIIDSCYARAKKVLTENIELVKSIAKYLIQVETLTKADIDEIHNTGKLKRADEMAKTNII